MSKEKYARQFDISRYRVITFDQRECGHSRFKDSLVFNTTQHLVDDMERLRQHLGIDHWFLNGGSWGATLCLAYAQQYPEHTRGLMLASTFLGDFERMSWLYGATHEIAVTRFPEEYALYRLFLKRFNIESRGDLGKLAYLLDYGSEAQKVQIVSALTRFERRLYVAQELQPEQQDVTRAMIATKRIYLHYARNRFFTHEGQFSQDLSTFKNLPIILVHGRLDCVCPLVDIERFAENKKQLVLKVLEHNGHSFDDDGKRMAEEAYTRFLDMHT